MDKLMVSLDKKTLLSFIIGLVFSAAALYLTFVNIPFRELVEYLGRVNYWWLIPSLLLALLSYALRIWRWQIILLPVKKAGFWSAYHPLVIGFMLNCVFPGRIGEIARPAIYYKRENVEFSKVLATAGIERIFDALCLLVFFIYILATVPIDPSLDVTFGGYHLTTAMLDRVWKTTLQFSLAIVAFIFLIGFSATRDFINKTILKVPDLLFFSQVHFRERLKNGICRKATIVLDNLAQGFHILKSPGYLVLSLVLSFVLWWLLGWSLYVLALGCPGVQVSLLQAFAVEIIVCFFIMLPSVPGYWGLWEAGGVFGFMIFGIPAKEAAGATLIYHFFHLIPVIVIGIISAVIIGFSLVKTTRNEEQAIRSLEEPDKEKNGFRVDVKSTIDADHAG